MLLFLRQQLPLIARLQHLTGLDAPLRILTQLGNEEFLLILLPLLYWCVDRRLGRRLGILLIGSDSLCTLLKVALALPRPYWISKSRLLATDSSFGLPSSHAMNAAALWPFLALQTQRRALWLTLAALLTGGIMLSRVYLGVHFPTDVLGGAVLGVAVLWAFARWMPVIEARAAVWSLGKQIGAATLSVGVLLLLFALARWIGMHAPFGVFRPPATHGMRHGVQDDPFSWEAIVTRAGALWGLLAGAALAARLAPFEATGSILHKIARAVVGLLGLSLFYLGLKLVFRDGASLAPLMLRFIRYALTTGWVVLGAPWLFARIGLAPFTVFRPSRAVLPPSERAPRSR